MNYALMNKVLADIQGLLEREGMEGEEASILLRILADRLHKAPMQWDEE